MSITAFLFWNLLEMNQINQILPYTVLTFAFYSRIWVLYNYNYFDHRFFDFIGINIDMWKSTSDHTDSG